MRRSCCVLGSFNKLHLCDIEQAHVGQTRLWNDRQGKEREQYQGIALVRAAELTGGIQQLVLVLNDLFGRRLGHEPPDRKRKHG